MGLNWRQFELGVLRPALAKLEPSIASPEVAVRLVGETIWHESDRLQALGQYPRDAARDRGASFGPGLGICSMERPTWDWLVKDYILRRSDLEIVFRQATGLFVVYEGAAYEHFAWNLALNVAACRLRYFVDRRPLPGISDWISRSELWFQIYNGSGVDERRLKYVEDAQVIPWSS